MLICGLVALAVGGIFGYDFFRYTLLTQKIINAPQDGLSTKILVPTVPWPEYKDLQSAKFSTLLWPWVGFSPRQIQYNTIQAVVYFLNEKQYTSFKTAAPLTSKIFTNADKVYKGDYHDFVLEGFLKDARKDDYILYYITIGIVAFMGLLGIGLILGCCCCCKVRKEKSYGKKNGMGNVKTTAYV